MLAHGLRCTPGDGCIDPRPGQVAAHAHKLIDRVVGAARATRVDAHELPIEDGGPPESPDHAIASLGSALADVGALRAYTALFRG